MPSGRAVSNKAPFLLNWSGCESEAKTKFLIATEPSGRPVSHKRLVLTSRVGESEVTMDFVFCKRTERSSNVNFMSLFFSTTNICLI